MKEQWMFVILVVVSPAWPVVGDPTSRQANLDALEQLATIGLTITANTSTTTSAMTPSTTGVASPKPTYNKETRIEGTTTTYETCFAILFVCIIAGGPALIHVVAEPGKPTMTVIGQATLTALVLIGGIYSFMNVIMFQSSHFVGPRYLTMVESVYLLAQIITTVGYGDIVPSHPLGLVVIGSFVIVSLFLIMDMISQVSQAVVNRVERYSHQLTEQVFDDALIPRTGNQYQDSHFFRKPEVSYLPVVTSGGALLLFILAGVFFYHLYPGEEKTWHQAVYMAIITLSTTGFGAFTADTAGGQVFGAFWMIFGVAALASFLGTFAELFLKLKERERHSEAAVRREMDAHLQKLQIGREREKMSREEFICFAAMQLQIASWEQLDSILWQFDELNPDQEGCVDMTGIEARIQGRTVTREVAATTAAEILVAQGP